MRIEPAVDRGAPLENAMRFFPENDKDVSDLTILASKANPDACKMAWDENEVQLMYFYITMRALFNASIASNASNA